MILKLLLFSYLIVGFVYFCRMVYEIVLFYIDPQMAVNRNHMWKDLVIAIGIATIWPVTLILELAIRNDRDH